MTDSCKGCGLPTDPEEIDCSACGMIYDANPDTDARLRFDAALSSYGVDSDTIYSMHTTTYTTANNMIIYTDGEQILFGSPNELIDHIKILSYDEIEASVIIINGSFVDSIEHMSIVDIEEIPATMISRSEFKRLESYKTLLLNNPLAVMSIAMDDEGYIVFDANKTLSEAAETISNYDDFGDIVLYIIEGDITYRATVGEGVVLTAVSNHVTKVKLNEQ